MSQHIVPGTDVYGPGSWIDQSGQSVQEDAQRVFRQLAAATPGFTDEKSRLESVTFEGSADPITPGPLKANVVASALHAMAGVVANEILDARDGTQESPDRRVTIDTDHASFWLGSVGMSERNGKTVREIAKAGELAGLFEKDLEGGTFATPIRLRATANYETKDKGVWYQLHGSLGADPVLQVIGVDPNMVVSSNDEAFRIIQEQVRKFGAKELEMINVEQGLCGSINYTPEQWRATRMWRDLSKHPLINYSRQPYAVPTPSVPLTPQPTDKRPLAGVKVVEVVRIIAGPVIGNTLASMGADVIRVNCGRLPDFNSLQLALNAGVRTIDVDFNNPTELADLKTLVSTADVFIQGYRPGVIARKGLGLHDLLEMAGNRGKGIVYVEENCYGPDGPMTERPGWQQVADAASGSSFVTARAMGHTDGTAVLPVLPVPDMTTGLIGAIGTMMALRDRTRKGGSYHVFASLMAAACLPLAPEIGLYSPQVLQKVQDKFQWDASGPDLFVLELLDIALKGWKKEYPDKFAAESPWFEKLEGPWGKFRVLRPVLRLGDGEVSPKFTTAPEPNCLRPSGKIAWL